MLDLLNLLEQHLRGGDGEEAGQENTGMPMSVVKERHGYAEIFLSSRIDIGSCSLLCREMMMMMMMMMMMPRSYGWTANSKRGC